MNAPITPQRLVATVIERIAFKCPPRAGINDLRNHTRYLIAEARDFPGAPEWLHYAAIDEHGCITFPEDDPDATLLEQETEIAGLKSALAKLQGEYRSLTEATQSLIEEGVCPFDHHHSHPCLFCKAKTHAQNLLNPTRPSGQ
jgi:hypothetical protein